MVMFAKMHQLVFYSAHDDAAYPLQLTIANGPNTTHKRNPLLRIKFSALLLILKQNCRHETTSGSLH